MDQRKTKIYILIDPCNGEVRYVGKTIRKPKHRLTEHNSGQCGAYTRNWIKSLQGIGESPIMEVIDEVGKDWEFWEMHYISLYKSWGFKLTNISIGGDKSSLGYKHISEDLIKIGEASKRFWRSMSPEKLVIHKNKLKESTRYNGRHNKRVIYEVDEYNNVICEYESAAEATRKFNIREPYLLRQSARKRGKGLDSTCSGRRFTYDLTVLPKKSEAFVRVEYYNNKGELLGEYDRISHASRALNINISTIANRVKTGRPMKDGFYFKKKSEYLAIGAPQ